MIKRLCKFSDQELASKRSKFNVNGCGQPTCRSTVQIPWLTSVEDPDAILAVRNLVTFLLLDSIGLL